MRRHSIHEAIILRQRPQGERNAGILLLTRDIAQIWAQAFGITGPKSSLRPLCQPFNSIRAFLYHDPEKQLWRLEDAELVQDALDLRSNMQGIYLAAFFSELLERSPFESGEEWPWLLMSELVATSGLQGIEAGELQRLFCLAIWKYLQCTGFVTEVGGALENNADLQFAQGALRWLAYSGNLGLVRGMTVGFDPAAVRSLAFWLVTRVEELLGHRLRSFSNPELLGF